MPSRANHQGFLMPGDDKHKKTYACIDCGIKHHPTRKGRCKNCDDFFRHHGKSKPGNLTRLPRVRSCLNCQQVREIEGLGRCNPYYKYWKEKNTERPREIIDRWNLHLVGKKKCGICKGILNKSNFYVGEKKGVRNEQSACKDCQKRRFRTWGKEWAKKPENLPLLRLHREERKLKKRAVYVERINRFVVYKRDNWICGICHEVIDPSLQWPDQMSASLDHVIPLSRGGKHEKSNVQAAHLLCNSRKQARIENTNLTQEVEYSPSSATPL